LEHSDAFWINRQKVLMAINRAVKKHGLEFSRLYRYQPVTSAPEWRSAPKRIAPKSNENQDQALSSPTNENYINGNQDKELKP